jgi:hypothetical protein
MVGAACNAIGPQNSSQSKPQSWIDAPLDGSALPLAPVEVVSHSSDSNGVAVVQLSVNGIVIQSDANLDQTKTLVTMSQAWMPQTTGNYTLLVRAQNSAGAWGDYAQAVVTVQGTVATPTRTPTATSVPVVQPRLTPSTPIATTLPPVGITFFSDATTLMPGACTTIHWQVTNASQVFLDNAPVAASGSKRDCPAQTTTYTLGIITLDNQSVRRTLTITVIPLTSTSTPTHTRTPTSPPPVGCNGTPVISSFSASPSTIFLGGSSTLSWGLVSNADSVEIDQGIGGVATPGSVVVSPSVTTVYTLTARCKGVAATARTVVTVNPPPIFFVTPTNTPIGVR